LLNRMNIPLRKYIAVFWDPFISENTIRLLMDSLKLPV
jgi:hypothetical protein